MVENYFGSITYQIYIMISRIIETSKLLINMMWVEVLAAYVEVGISPFFALCTLTFIFVDGSKYFLVMG